MKRGHFSGNTPLLGAFGAHIRFAGRYAHGTSFWPPLVSGNFI